jgi:hypothetical protein
MKKNKKKNNGVNGKWFLSGDCLPDQYAQAGSEGMKNVAYEWTKNWEENDKDIETNRSKVLVCGIGQANDNISYLAANDKAKKQTISRYASIWKNLKDFSIVIGDYKTALICDQSEVTLCSYRPESASVDTCIHFMRFNTCKDDTDTSTVTYLTHYNTQQRVLDVMGNPIQCMGNWKVSKTLSTYKMAINKLHNHFREEIGSDYQEKCSRCCELNGKCDQHIDYPRLFRKGNPTTTQKFRTQFDILNAKLLMDDKDRKTGAFLPSELRDIREFCLSKNTKYSLMMWTIMVVGVKLFLRIEEILKMKIEDFNKELFLVDESNVNALAVVVQGKSDNKPKDLLIWDEDDLNYKYTEFSPTRAILMWLKISRIQHGYLFPCRKELNEGISHPTEPFPYKEYLKFIKSLFKTQTNVTGIISKAYDPKELHGTHILRKTGYLLAIWGSKQDNSNCNVRHASITMSSRNLLGEITKSARHNTDSKHISTYIGDAETLYESMKASTKDDWKKRNEVGKWKSIHIFNRSYFLAGNKGKRKHQIPIVQLVNKYFSTMAKIGEELWDESVSISALHRRMDSYKPFSGEQNLQLSKYPKLKNSIEDVESMLSSSLPEKDKQKALSLLNRVKLCAVKCKGASERVKKGAETAKKRMIEEHLEEGTRMSKRLKPDACTTERHIVLDMDYRKLSQECKTKEEEIKYMLHAIESVIKQKKQKKVFKDGALKAWVHKIAKPCLCVKMCFHGSVDDFLKTFPKFIYSKHDCINSEHKDPLKTLEVIS